MCMKMCRLYTLKVCELNLNKDVADWVTLVSNSSRCQAASIKIQRESRSMVKYMFNYGRWGKTPQAQQTLERINRPKDHTFHLTLSNVRNLFPNLQNDTVSR